MTDPTPAPPLTALLVEDDEQIGQLLKFILQREKFLVRWEMDGRAALAAIETAEPPAIALFDVMLPFVDGFQLIAAARARPEWNAVPVLMLTAKAQERDIVRALDAGANGYVHKPFKPDELVSRIRSAIAGNG
ncbi:MAG: response regulator transcription factor [Ramlibacter sp.]